MAILSFKSIKTKLLVMTLTIIMVLIIIFISIFGFFTERILKNVINQSSINNVEAYGKIIGNWFYERMSEIEVYSENPTIKSMEWYDIQPYLIREMGKQIDTYRLFLISDLEGNYNTNFQKNAGSIYDRDYFHEVIKGNTVISNPVISKSTGGYIAVVATPIRHTNRDVKGIFAGAIDLVKLYKFVDEFKVSNHSYNTYIIDKNGMIITHENKSMIMKESITEKSEEVNENITKVAAQILQSSKGVAEFISNDNRIFAYYSQIPNTDGWRIVTEAPVESLYDPLYKIQRVFGIIGLVSLVIGVIVSLKLAKSQSKPILELKNVFDKAASGNLTIRASEERKDELGAAAKSFNIMMDKISHMTYYDPLTSLPNRNYFIQSLEEAIKCYENDSKIMGIAMLSIDKFKEVNNVYGHSIGDKVLTEVAYRVGKIIDLCDTLSRISGDEFILLFVDKDKESLIIKYMERILNEIRKPFIIEENNIYITSSIGISLYPGDGKDVQTLFKNASIARSYVKEMGGDNYRVHNQAMNNKLNEQVKISKLLYSALDRNEIFINYQPFISMKTGKVIGMEALVRWENSELGYVSPGKFIPLAEQSGQIIELGKWVLKEACRQNKEWQDKGFKPIPVSVNVSAKQLENENFVETVRRVLNETGLSPKYLELEITEGVAMENVTSNLEKLSKLHDMGIGIAIDDFGTGYSSLNYLTKFPISTLKIDQSFIREIPENLRSMQIVSTIISMAKNLNLNTTAEGVETKEQLKFINKETCDNVQGYLFSKPILPNEFEAILSENKKFNI